VCYRQPVSQLKLRSLLPHSTETPCPGSIVSCPDGSMIYSLVPLLLLFTLPQPTLLPGLEISLLNKNEVTQLLKGPSGLLPHMINPNFVLGSLRFTGSGPCPSPHPTLPSWLSPSLAVDSHPGLLPTPPWDLCSAYSMCVSH
jgi:hypothetical protein